MTAVKEYRGANLREVFGLETSTRVFAAYVTGLNVGFVTVDDKANTVELVYVMEMFRGKGIAAALLDLAREVTGLSLDADTGERTLEGSRWAKARGLRIAKGRRYRRLAKGDIARQIAVISWASMNEPEDELTLDGVI